MPLTLKKILFWSVNKNSKLHGQEYNVTLKFYPPTSEADREVANLILSKNVAKIILINWLYSLRLGSFASQVNV